VFIKPKKPRMFITNWNSNCYIYIKKILKKNRLFCFFGKKKKKKKKE
jgi:hypothetical protein